MSELFPNFQFESKPELPDSAEASSELLAPDFVPMSDFWAENLISQAKRFRDLEPWNKIRENEFIGIESPQTGEISLISVLGRGCKIFALHLHKPPEGIAFWHRAISGEPPKPGPAFEHLHMLECEFVSKDDALPVDLAFVKRYAKPARKRKGLPSFRSYRPGFYPWKLDDYEAHELSLVFDLFFLYFDTAFPGKHSSFYKWAKNDDDIHQIPILKLKPDGSANYLSDWEVVTQPIPSLPETQRSDSPDLNNDNPLELYLFSKQQPDKPDNKRPYFPTVMGLFQKGEDQPVQSRCMAPTKSKAELCVDILNQTANETNPSAIKIYTDSNLDQFSQYLASRSIPNQIESIDPKSKRFSELVNLNHDN